MNSFCDETSRTWTLLGPEIRYHGFCLGLSPKMPSRPEVLKVRTLDHKHQHFGNLLVMWGLGSSLDLLNQKFCVLVCPQLNVWEPWIWFSTRHVVQHITWSLSRPGLALMWVEKTSFAFNLRLKQEAAQWPILFPLPVTYTQGPMTFQSWEANFLVQTHIRTCTHTHSVFLFLKHRYLSIWYTFFSILLLSLNIIPKRFFPTSTQDPALRQRSCCGGNGESSSKAHTTRFWLWLCLGLWFHDSAPRPVSAPSWPTGPSTLIPQTSFLCLTMTSSPNPGLFLLLLSCYNNNIPESLCFV